MNDFYLDDKTTKKGMKVMAAEVRTEVTLGKERAVTGLGPVEGARAVDEALILDPGGGYGNICRMWFSVLVFHFTFKRLF